MCKMHKYRTVGEKFIIGVGVLTWLSSWTATVYFNGTLDLFFLVSQPSATPEAAPLCQEFRSLRQAAAPLRHCATEPLSHCAKNFDLHAGYISGVIYMDPSLDKKFKNVTKS